MNGTLSKVLMFVAGATVGSVVTWKLLKTHYEQLAQEEIDEIREFYTDRNSEEKVDDDTEEARVKIDLEHNAYKKPDLATYAATIKELQYAAELKEDDDDDEEEDDNYYGEEDDDVEDRPYVISPEEVGDLDDYELIELIHFADDILTDENHEIIDDIAGTVGLDYAEHFGEYEQDSVHVRNDRRRCDYEILRDERNFEDL